MKRRDFIKLSGLTATGGLLSSCGTKPEKLIPLLVPPENGHVPGRPDYYASTCRQCPAGCGIVVTVSEGRARKIEGNPAHPVNGGKLCARGQAALQELYHPDRIRQPLLRDGERGSGAFRPVSWEEALGELSEKLDGSNRRRGGPLLVTPPATGPSRAICKDFVRRYGGRHLSFEPSWHAAYAEAARRMYGTEGPVDYPFEDAQYVISFGADFLESFASPVLYGRRYGQMRRARPTVRGLLAYVGARMSMTAASADTWLPAKPGTEALLALGMARVLLTEKRVDLSALEGRGIDGRRMAKDLSDYEPAAVAEATGLEVRHVVAAARDFARLRPAVAIPGDGVAGHTNGIDGVSAVHLLNVLVGNTGRPGGVRLTGPNTVLDAAARPEAVLNELAGDRTPVLLLHRVNPVYRLPASTGIRDTVRSVPYVVACSPMLDDTVLEADLVLPTHTDLESWGEVVPPLGVPEGTVGLLQPVVRPVFDTRAFEDLMIGLGRRKAGGRENFENLPRFVDLLMDSAGRRMEGSGRSAGDGAWTRALQHGGIFPEGAEERGLELRHPVTVYGLQKPEISGDIKEYPLHLNLFPAPLLFDGRSAHLPWLQETPDPMTTVVWDSWVEIHPETAKKLGIQQGDLVEVRSPAATVRVPAVLFPAIRPDVVAIPLGQGHRGNGRYADKRGVNGLDLLAPPPRGGLPVPGGTRVSVRRISGDSGLVVFGHPEGSHHGEFIQI